MIQLGRVNGQASWLMGLNLSWRMTASTAACIRTSAVRQFSYPANNNEKHMNLEKCHRQSDLRKAAKKRLPSPMFNYLDGGADDEWTLQRNTAAFDAYEFLPRYLRDVEQIYLKTSVLGTTLDLPVFLAPTGMSRLFHHDREIAVAKAAQNYGTLYSLSTLGTASIEEISQVNSGPKMFQIYMLKDRELIREFLQRSKDNGFKVMCLTVDAPLAGNR